MRNPKAIVVALIVAMLMGPAQTMAANVAISIKHPGGNALIGEKQGNTIELAPDLRGGSDWFYWNFDATADGPGEVHFKIDQIGPQGPSHSTDGGKTWSWLGREAMTRDADNKVTGFTYTFDKAGQTVRFAVAIPYQLANLNAFLDKYTNNPNLKQSVLTKSRHGRDVPLLQLGEPGEGKEAIIMTCRHHACESMASYMLEGVIDEILSDSEKGRAFLRKHVVYIIPMVDIDGVEEGDQGKNRSPHDHNRDYIPGGNLYPETGAIMKMADEKNIRYSIDFHCPALNGTVHHVFYWDGPRFQHAEEAIEQLRRWQEEESPPMLGITHNFMKAITPNRTPMNSDFFGYRDNVVLAATIEVPYSQPGLKMTEDMVRAYGVGFVSSWLRTNFTPGPDYKDAKDLTTYHAFSKFRSMINAAKGNPALLSQYEMAVLDMDTVSPIYRMEISLAIAQLHLERDDYKNFDWLLEQILKNENSTYRQKLNGTLLKLQGDVTRAGADHAKAAKDIETALENPVWTRGDQSTIYNIALNYYKSQKQYEKAYQYSDLLLDMAQLHKKPEIMFEQASLLELMNKPEEAAALKQAGVELLQKSLDPVPQNPTAPYMANILLEVYDKTPSSTKQQLIDVIKIQIDHKDTRPEVRKALEQRLSDLQKK